MIEHLKSSADLAPLDLTEPSLVYIPRDFNDVVDPNASKEAGSLRGPRYAEDTVQTE